MVYTSFQYIQGKTILSNIEFRLFQYFQGKTICNVRIKFNRKTKAEIEQDQ
jgi:hypothetical protein